MITDDQVQLILKGLSTLETRFDKLETRFDTLETRFDALETRFDKLETRFDKLETRFEDLTILAVQTQHQIGNLITREEFNDFKNTNATAHDQTSKHLKTLEQELRIGHQAHIRLERRVTKLEENNLKLKAA